MRSEQFTKAHTPMKTILTAGKVVTDNFETPFASGAMSNDSNCVLGCVLKSGGYMTLTDRTTGAELMR
jgi:predicted RNA-binding protein (virulence factor B family)